MTTLTGNLTGSSNPYTGAQQLNVPGLGNFSAKDVVSWVNTHSPTELGNVVNQYGVDPAALVATYNTGAGTNFSTADAANYLGLPAPAPQQQFEIPESVNTSSRTSGTDWSGPVGSALLPQLLQSARALPGLTQNYGNNLQSMYSNLMNQALRPGALQGTLNNLSSRGLLNSSIASNALANTATNIARNIGNQAFGSYQAGLNKQLALPTVLAALAAQNTKGVSFNPLAQYQLFASMMG